MIKKTDKTLMNFLPKKGQKCLEDKYYSMGVRHLK